VFHRDTPSEVRALDGVDLAVERGTFTVVVGTNGSGKSSLLNAIAGSLGLTGGRVFLDGNDLSVAENLVLAGGRGGPRGLRRALGRERRRDVREQVARLGLGLEDRLDTPIGLLSGGQRQALTLLMATMVKPSLLLLDEHTAALDPRSAEQVIRLTQAAVARGALTTLMVTHSLGQAVALGDRILVMHRGRVVHDLGDVRRRRLTEGDLLQLFDRLRWADRLDTAAAEMLRRAYI
jgi:putative ABC transport system ATP-binding protein